MQLFSIMAQEPIIDILQRLNGADSTLADFVPTLLRLLDTVEDKQLDKDARRVALRDIYPLLGTKSPQTLAIGSSEQLRGQLAFMLESRYHTDSSVRAFLNADVSDETQETPRTSSSSSHHSPSAPNVQSSAPTSLGHGATLASLSISDFKSMIADEVRRVHRATTPDTKAAAAVTKMADSLEPTRVQHLAGSDSGAVQAAVQSLLAAAATIGSQVPMGAVSSSALPVANALNVVIPSSSRSDSPQSRRSRSPDFEHRPSTDVYEMASPAARFFNEPPQPTQFDSEELARRRAASEKRPYDSCHSILREVGDLLQIMESLSTDPSRSRWCKDFILQLLYFTFTAQSSFSTDAANAFVLAMRNTARARGIHRSDITKVSPHDSHVTTTMLWESKTKSSSSRSSSSTSTGKAKCHWCGNKGHKESECRQKQAGKPRKADDEKKQQP